MYRIVSVRVWCRPLAVGAVFLLLLTAIGITDMLPRATQATSATDRVVLPIIMYHGILKDAARQGQYVISPALFESDLAYIRQQGYTTVVMQELLDYVLEGKPLPEKPIMLTFDDGYYNNYAYAYPLLQQYDMRAVLSPVVAWSEFYSNDPAESDRVLYSHVTWAQLREMAESGVFEIQNHSYDMHKNAAGQRKGTLKRAEETTVQYHAALKEDLAAAQALLTEKVGVTPTTFTYPFGAMSKEAIPVLQELGFCATLTCEGRVNALTRDPACLWGLGRYLRPAGNSSAAYFGPIFRAADAARTGIKEKIMEQKKIDRINELAKKSKAEGLTPAETAEQKALRAEYVAAFRASLTAQLDNTVIVDKDGNRIKPTRKPGRNGPAS